MEILIGLLIIAVGSFGQSSSYVPIRKVRDWSWESFWLVQGIFAWIVFPWLGASLALPEGVTLGALWAAGGAWQSVFYGVVLITAVALVLFIAFYRQPVGKSNIANYGVEGSMSDCFKYLKNKYIWLLGLTFLVFNFIQGGVVNTYYPTYLSSMGFDAGTAGFMTSIITLIGFIMNPLSGAWSDRLPINKKFILVTLFAATSFIGFIVGFPEVMGPLSMAGIWFFIVLMGFSAAFGGGGSRPLAPTILSSSAMAATLGMAVMQFTPRFTARVSTRALAGWEPPG